MTNNGLERTGTELKPCHFCGGEPHFAVSSDGYAVECDGELCLRNAMQEHPSEEYAALWWNTRADFEYGAVTMTEENMAAHGWVRKHTCRIKEDETGFLVCSECGAVQPEEWTVYYCWSCGARVVEEVDADGQG